MDVAEGAATLAAELDVPPLSYSPYSPHLLDSWLKPTLQVLLVLTSLLPLFALN